MLEASGIGYQCLFEMPVCLKTKLSETHDLAIKEYCRFIFIVCTLRAMVGGLFSVYVFTRLRSVAFTKHNKSLNLQGGCHSPPAAHSCLTHNRHADSHSQT